MQTYLIGYGTLLHRGSLGHSIGQGAAQERERVAVVIHDYRRLFDLRPDHYTSSNKLGEAPVEDGALNLEAAPGERFNGLAFPVQPEELIRIDERERFYERVVVPMFRFETGEAIGDGHVYIAPLEAPWVIRDTSELLPLWRDIVWSRAGAYQIGDAFGREFDATTYMADGETLVVDRYGELLNDTSDVEMPS